MTSAPFTTRYHDLDGLGYAYVDEGCGPPVVLVHGNPSWSFAFRSLLHALPAAGHRALAPDHIGMGRSAKPARSAYPHTLSSRVSDFGRWMDAVLPSEPVTLLLHDWGGAIGLGWAVEHPDRVARLVLLNTAAFPPEPGTRLPLVLRAARAPLLGELAVRYANAFVRGATRLGVTRRLPPEVRRGYREPYDRPAHRVGVLEFVRDIPTGPQDPAYAALQRIEARLPGFRDRPVLICWGLRDPVLGGAVLARWERLLPQAEVHRFPDAGHYVLEDAAGAAGELVVDFLARTAVPAAP